MCNYRSIIFLFLIFCFPKVTEAQENLRYSFRQINQSDGLLHNQVYSITQDGKGFIWIATANGLQRYDGSRFIYYPELLTNPAEEITYRSEIYADKKTNLLWIIKNNTIEKMELAKNKFTVYDQEKLLADPAFSFNTYNGVNGEQWIAGSSGVYSYDSVSKKTMVNSSNVLPGNTHQSSYIVTDSINNNIWVALGPQLFLFNKKNNTAYSGNFNPVNHPLLNSSLYGTGERLPRLIMIDSKQNIWVTTWGSLFYKYDEKLKKIHTYSLSAIKKKEENGYGSSAGMLINCILEDNNHTIWVGTENAGLLRYNMEKDDFDYSFIQEKNSEGIKYNSKISSLFQDKEQNIWIGTDKGISIFNPYRQYFRSIRHEETNSPSIQKSEIQSFVQLTNGDIYIGTWGNGITVYDSSFHFKKTIIFKGAPENNYVWSFQQMDSTTLWIGCQHGYLTEYNINTGKTKSLHPEELQGFTIRCMEKDRDGNIWFGLHNGKIIKWDKKEKIFLPYGADSLKRASTVLNIFIDSSQNCWVSTEAGFKQFNLNKRIFTNTWLPDKNNTNAISAKTCLGIEEYNDSTLLIGTIYGGINFFNKRTKVFSRLPATDGLPSQTIYAIKKDTAGYIWFTTDYGLYKFNLKEKKIIPFSIESGIINSSFKSSLFYPLKDGQWVTLTTTEAISFFPGKTASQTNLQPKIEITGFKVFDKAVFIDSLLFENKPVQLSYKENFFSVEFAALNFLTLQQTNYYYRLKDLDKNWVSGGTKRSADYTDLQPGEYIFEVKAEIGNNISEITSFKIIISPPIWQTIWFKLLYIVLIAGIIYAIAKWRINTAYKEAKRKMHFTKLIAEMEMKALRSQMNPHFIFNCINSIDALIQSNDKYNATVYLNKFAKLLRNILDTNKHNTVTFSKDIDTLKLYIELEELRHENKFKTSFKIDEQLLSSDYKVPPLVIQPFVENAILHGLKNKDDNEGRLSIDIKKVNDKILYTITDNGIGRKAAEKIMQNKESHYGMQISYDRIKLFNREEYPSVKITDLYHDGAATGTAVTVNLNII